MKNKRELIETRVRALFGEIGYKKGQYYVYGDSEIVEVCNDGGGVRVILTSSGPQTY